MMFLTRLTLIITSLIAAGTSAVAAVVPGLTALAPGAPNPDAPKPGPDDLPGRVVDKSGKGVAGVQVWAIDGPWWTPGTVAKTTTDGEGRFVVPWARSARGQRGAQDFGLFARSQDGRIGWQHPAGRLRADGKGVEVELQAVNDVSGRLTDQNGRPIDGVEIAAVFINESFGRNSSESIRFSPELTALFRTTTAADGSFVLKGIAHGAGVQVTIAAPAFGSPLLYWDTTSPRTIALDGRLGRIEGRLKLPDPSGLPPRLQLGLHGSPQRDNAVPGPYEVFCRREGSTDEDGTFRFDNLPPGRYTVDAYSAQASLIATKPRYEIDVGPGAVASLEIPLQRLATITGRLVDAQTGKGIAGVNLTSYLLEEGKNSKLACGQATTDADGRYAITARPGKIQIEVRNVPKTHLGLNDDEFPTVDVIADRTLPELKLSPATGLDGVVVDQAGQPVVGAEMFVVAPEPAGDFFHGLPTRTGPGGAFHLEKLDPDVAISLRARRGDATTNGAVVIQPNEVRAKGKLTLTIDPAHSARIRGLVTDLTGKRIAGADLTLRWHRSFVSSKPGQGAEIGSPLATYMTSDNGWFVFRDLWPGDRYSIVIEAKDHARIETPEMTGKAGQTHDLGKIVLVNTNGYLAGRVVGSDGGPIDGANVFNSGDAPERVATSTDSRGRFRLEGLFPGRKFAFIRKAGYRFTGIKVDDDADGLTITLLKTGEPPPAWKPGSAPSYDEQRAFAKQVLIRLWEKYGADPEKTGAARCVGDMAEIDPDLALEWSSRHGRRYDDVARLARARKLAETDAPGALAMLNQRPDTESQSVLQDVAERFAEIDPKKALLFAEEAAVQSRGLNQPDRTRATARAGAVLVELGRADAGRKLIDEAARDAAQLPAANWAGNCRSAAARILAPYDVERALALVEPFKAVKPNWWQGNRVSIAVAIAKADTGRAVALVDSLKRPGFDRELARTEIAYKIGSDRPDEAIKIIERGFPRAGK